MNITVKNKYVEVERVITERVPKRVITLELTEEEATAVCVVLGQVRGESGHVDSVRTFTEPIYNALNNAGIGYATTNYRRFVKHIQGSLRVKVD